MLPRDQIEEAVEIQQGSYRLLLWLGEAIDRGRIQFTRAHGDASAGDNAREWLTEHYNLLPEELRPRRDRLREFGNYFGSYVTTSFDLLDESGYRRESPCGCCCDFCAQLVNASHLHPRKLARRDKEEAAMKRTARVIELAREEGMQVTEENAARIAGGPLLRSAAYSAYGQSLLERINGAEGGPVVLALWREIAWKPEGSPIKGFKLAAADIFEAEERLIAEIRKSW